MIKIKKYNAKHRHIIEKFGYNVKKSTVYQNFKYYMYPSLFIEKTNPEHKAILYGMRKRRYRKTKYTTVEKIALLSKTVFPFYVFALLFHLLMIILLGG